MVAGYIFLLGGGLGPRLIEGSRSLRLTTLKNAMDRNNRVTLLLFVIVPDNRDICVGHVTADAWDVSLALWMVSIL